MGTAVPSTDNLIHLGRLFGVAVDVLVNEHMDLDGNLDINIEEPEVPAEPAVAEKKRPVAIPIRKLIIVVVCALLLFTVIGMRLLSDGPEQENTRSWDSLESEIIDMSSGDYFSMP